MTDLLPAILTPEEAVALMNCLLTPPVTSAQPYEDATAYVQANRLYRQARRQQARQDLQDLYGETLEPDALTLVEATTHWAVTSYGLLSLEDGGCVIRFEDIFDRQLLARMAGTGGIDLREFTCCLVFARAYSLRHRPGYQNSDVPVL